MMGTSHASQFIDDEISRLLDSGASGRHALFLLRPLLQSALAYPKHGSNAQRDGLINALLHCVEKQLELASKRQYSHIFWDSTESTVTSSLLTSDMKETKTNVSRNSASVLQWSASLTQWTDKDTLRHPNMILVEWLSDLLAESASKQEEGFVDLYFHLFKAWNTCLKSPNMCLKEKGARMLSVILQRVVAVEGPSVMTQLVSILPAHRILCLTKSQLQREKLYFSVVSKYLQSFVQVSASVAMVFNMELPNESISTNLIISNTLVDQMAILNLKKGSENQRHRKK